MHKGGGYQYLTRVPIYGEKESTIEERSQNR